MTMNSWMFFPRSQHQIIGVIILLVLVVMVHDFMRAQFAPKFSFHNVLVLVEQTTVWISFSAIFFYLGFDGSISDSTFTRAVRTFHFGFFSAFKNSNGTQGFVPAKRTQKYLWRLLAALFLSPLSGARISTKEFTFLALSPPHKSGFANKECSAECALNFHVHLVQHYGGPRNA